MFEQTVRDHCCAEACFKNNLANPNHNGGACAKRSRKPTVTQPPLADVDRTMEARPNSSIDDRTEMLKPARRTSAGLSDMVAEPESNKPDFDIYYSYIVFSPLRMPPICPHDFLLQIESNLFPRTLWSAPLGSHRRPASYPVISDARPSRTPSAHSPRVCRGGQGRNRPHCRKYHGTTRSPFERNVRRIWTITATPSYGGKS